MCTWRITVSPGLRSPESHTLDRDDFFMVTSATVQLAPDTAALGPGDTAVVPAGSPIQLVNPGDRPAEAFVVIGSGFTGTMQDGSTVDTPPWAR